MQQGKKKQQLSSKTTDVFRINLSIFISNHPPKASFKEFLFSLTTWWKLSPYQHVSVNSKGLYSPSSPSSQPPPLPLFWVFWVGSGDSGEDYRLHHWLSWQLLGSTTLTDTVDDKRDHMLMWNPSEVDSERGKYENVFFFKYLLVATPSQLILVLNDKTISQKLRQINTFVIHAFSSLDLYHFYSH